MNARLAGECHCAPAEEQDGADRGCRAVADDAPASRRARGAAARLPLVNGHLGLRPHRPRHRALRARTLTLTTLVVLLGPVVAAPAFAADSSGSATATRDELGEAQPLNAPGQTLYLQRVTIPAGATLVDHFHAGTQVARVVKGVLTYDVISGTVTITRRDGTTETVTGPKTVKIRPGESLVEVESLAHAGANAGKTPVVIELAALLATGAPLATPLDAEPGATPITLTADLTSQGTTLHEVTGTGPITYGWNRLTGTAQSSSGPVEVELLGSVAYTSGSGPFSGFVTFTFADGSVLGTQVQGAALEGADGGTQIAATLGVLGGTGPYAAATGAGTFTGTRAAALGQPVAATFTVTLAPK